MSNSTPELKQPKEERLLNISFLNVLPETPEEILTEYLNGYADIKGTAYYPKKNYDGIQYCTGTRLYQVIKLHEHMPRLIHNIFGRTVICIYKEQPEEKQKNKNTKRTNYKKTNHESDTNTDEELYDSDTTTSETEHERK